MNFFTADPHFSKASNNVLRRPFSNAWEMSEFLLDKINAKVKRNDTLTIVGDFAFTLADVRFFRQQIKCKNTNIIIGNHNISKIRLESVFGKHNVRIIWDTKCKDRPFFLSHYCHAYWPKSHYGSFHGYGHTHDMRESTMDDLFPGRRSMDLGLDTAKRLLGEYEPFSEDEIYELLIGRPGHDQVEFYIETVGAYNKC